MSLMKIQHNNDRRENGNGRSKFGVGHLFSRLVFFFSFTFLCFFCLAAFCFVSGRSCDGFKFDLNWAVVCIHVSPAHLEEVLFFNLYCFLNDRLCSFSPDCYIAVSTSFLVSGFFPFVSSSHLYCLLLFLSSARGPLFSLMIFPTDHLQPPSRATCQLTGFSARISTSASTSEYQIPHYQSSTNPQRSMINPSGRTSSL